MQRNIDDRYFKNDRWEYYCPENAAAATRPLGVNAFLNWPLKAKVKAGKAD